MTTARETAVRMIDRYGARVARLWATDHAFGYDGKLSAGRVYWMAVIDEIDNQDRRDRS